MDMELLLGQIELSMLENLKDDKFNGQGTLFDNEGSPIYIGEWQDSKYNGHGTRIKLDGSRYIGGWKNDKAHGQGIYIFSDGKSIKNTKVNGKMVKDMELEH